MTSSDAPAAETDRTAGYPVPDFDRQFCSSHL